MVLSLLFKNENKGIPGLGVYHVYPDQIRQTVK